MAFSQFKDNLTLDDFTLNEGATTDNSVNINTNGYNTVYYLELEKGEGIALGQGRDATQHNAEGRLHAEFDQDAGTDIAGKMRFVIINRQFNVKRVISQFDLGVINRGSGTYGDRQPFPVQERARGGKPLFKAYPRRIAIQIKSETDGITVDDAQSGTTAEIDAIRLEETS